MPYDDPTPITTVQASSPRPQPSIARRQDIALWATIAKTGGNSTRSRSWSARSVRVQVSTSRRSDPLPAHPGRQLYLAMQRIQAGRLPDRLHAENATSSRGWSRGSRRKAGRMPARTLRRDLRWRRPRPAGRALELALATGVRVHIVHATVERTFQLVARARRPASTRAPKPASTTC